MSQVTRIFITGINGFAGSHLAEHLLAEKLGTVFGCGHIDNLPAHLRATTQFTQLDLCDLAATTAALQACQPDQIYHLAGQAFVPQSWDDPWATFAGNVQATLNLIAAARTLPRFPRMLIVTSIEVYGQVAAADLPITEHHPLHPTSPYGVSKVAQDLLAQTYAREQKLPIFTARPLNHIGPRQDARFVVSSFAAQIAEIEAGLKPPVIHVGDLSAQRDFTDVRDIVRAYALLMQHATPTECYNIGSGRLVTIEAILHGLLAHSQMPITIQVDNERLRPIGQMPLIADTSKIRQATGWQPQISLEKTLQDVLTVARQVYSKKY